tara:strand:- start:247 stop:921 length:675 start_codon:yes stop_codon:yes gene_type:complete
MSVFTTGPNADGMIDPDKEGVSAIELIDPYDLFGSWFGEARQKEPNDPNAMTLATVDDDGTPSARMVLLKDFDSRGFVFYTNYASRKGQALHDNPAAALLFHWKSLRRQVRIEGDVVPVDPADADAYFASRARGSRIGAWASLQSQPLDSRETLKQRVAELEQQYGTQDDIPRPPHWSGFRVVPRRIEFWEDMPFRLHNRMVFTADPSVTEGPVKGWRTERLYP